MSAAAPGAAAPPAGNSLAASFGLSPAQMAQVAMTYGYVAFWIVTSAGVILYNKWILTVWGFDYPITLTMWHMAFCSFVSAVLVRAARGARGGASRGRRAARRGSVLSVVLPRFSRAAGAHRGGAWREHDAAALPGRRVAHRCAPIPRRGGAAPRRAVDTARRAEDARAPPRLRAAPGALFSGTLWFGNAAYTYLSVSFIQMLKALMPAAVYTCSVLWVRPARAYHGGTCACTRCLRVVPHPARSRTAARTALRAAPRQGPRAVFRAPRVPRAAHPAPPRALCQGVEQKKTETMYIMGVISFGVAVASYGTHSAAQAP
jgi:hypothetical protein